MSQPLVSVVVPTYNRAGFVETAIQSLLDQEYEALEVLALDDGSSDETPALLERIADRSDPKRFRWWRHDNIGQAATINRGFELAGGELLGYLSSDDYLLPGAIERLVAAAEEHDADVVYPDYAVVDDTDRVQQSIRVLQHTFVDSLRWALCIPGVGALMRRRCYERIGGWDPRYRFCPDYEWWLRAGDARFVAVHEPIGAWRAHDGSITMDRPDVEAVRVRLEERLAMLDEVYARDDLPVEIVAVKAQAYASTLIEMALLMDQGGADRRFDVEDLLAPQQGPEARQAAAETRHWYQRKNRVLAGGLEAAEYARGQLEQTVEALEQALAQREAHAAALAERAAALEARLSRPLWLRLARRLVPPPLRPRLGAAAHRLIGRGSA